MNTGTLWRCPKCKRQFRKRKQLHSCVSYSVRDHFKDKPAARKQTFDRLIAKARQFGPVRTDAVKSLITISGRFHFAAVYVRRNSLTLEFVLERKLSDRRIEKVQKVLARYSHFVRLTGLEDVDTQLVNWLQEAYFVTGPLRDDEKPTLFRSQR